MGTFSIAPTAVIASCRFAVSLTFFTSINAEFKSRRKWQSTNTFIIYVLRAISMRASVRQTHSCTQPASHCNLSPSSRQKRLSACSSCKVVRTSGGIPARCVMRSRAKIAIIAGACLLLITTCMNLNTNNTILQSDYHQPDYKANRNVIKTTAASLIAPYKHVTKSLAELGKMDEINKYLVFVNAVPNSGSELLVILLKWLQGWNNFKHVKLQGSRKRLSNIEIEEFVYNTYEIIRNEAVPTSVDRMIYFVNFTRHDRQSPSYINLIREPADYVLSRFHHIMQNDALSHLKTPRLIEQCVMGRHADCQFPDDKKFDLAIPYFCGQHEDCQRLNSDWALKQAQQIVEKYYVTLGVLDELNATLAVLEHKLPYFFKGASKIYYRDLLQPTEKQRRKTVRASAAFKKRMKITLHKEYEFYEWTKSRLFRQLQIIYGH